MVSKHSDGAMVTRRAHSRLRTRFGGAALVATVIALLTPLAPTAQGDVTPPTLTGQSPPAGTTGISTLIDVVGTFSEPIQPATLAMVLRNSSNQVVASQVAYDSATRTATLNPNNELAGSQVFTVTVSGARDLAGNVMAQVSWSFTTATAGFQDVVLPQTGLVDPTVIEFASDDRVFVAEKSGRLWVFDNLADATPTLVADLRISVHNFWDRGMLGMALHPNFPATPYVYVLYAYDAIPGGTAPRWGSPTAPALGDPCPTPPGATGNGCVVTGRLSRLNIGNPASWPLDETDEDPLVTDWPQQFPSHSTGALVFGPDGALYATGGDGASFNYADYGQTSSTPAIADPANQGGALRSQDIRTSGDPVTLAGSVIRIDPDTGAALPDNPRFSSDPDQNGKRIIAHGLRNPFRLTIRPGTSEVWVGDVGWSTWEEINRVVDPLVTVDNFGWPCYEGNAAQGSYDSLNLSICETLYAQGSGAIVQPYYTYNHSSPVVTGEACPTGGSSISGLAFYPESGGAYPSSYNGALFFSDYSRNCIWAMRVGGNGLPDPANRVTIRSGGGGPVNLVPGPDGDILYPGYDDDRLHRLRYFSGNLPPAAVAQANPTSGASPLTVSFSANGSTDPEGLALAYAWDLDADGAFDDSTSATPQWTYAGTGTVTARVRVTDPAGLSGVAAVNIAVNNAAPTAIIDSPAASFTWKVGDVITFSGRGADPDAPSGFLPASSLSWDLIMHHCPSNCHTHTIQSFPGVASGTQAAPDHEYPSHLELRLTVTDAGGLQSSASVLLQPQTVAITLQSSPSGLQLGMNAAAQQTPFTRTVIVGSANSVAAPSPQAQGGSYGFTSWSDGGAQNHTITAPATPSTYTATYSLQQGPPPGLVAAYAMNEGAGPTTADWTGNGLTGTINGAAWTPQGRFGGALSFDGVNDWLTVADANALDFTSAMTLEAWVFPVANGGGSWRNVLIKERTGGEAYNLYANADTNAPTVYVARASLPDSPIDARGTSQLALNAWSHLAVTFDNATLRLYVNGTQVGTRAVAGPLLTTTGALRMGGNAIWGEFFEGRIDEVRLYNRSLTPAEIQADMNLPVGVDQTPPARSNGQPSGTLAAGTTQTTLGLTTNENATCRYGTTPGVAYDSLGATFTTTGGSSHATTISGLTNGNSYTYYARCRDGATNTNTDDFAITFSVANPAPPDTTPPTVSMTAPAAGSVSGNVTVSANATDSVGVVGVQFLLDGAPLGAEDTSAPYSVVWNSTTVANGTVHQLAARARDLATNQATATAVSVTVNNAGLGPVASYSFNETAGVTLADRTGQGNTGTVSGATWTPQGRFGGALTFDGVNDWVTIADANSLDFTTAMTLEAWVYPTASGGGSWRNVLIKERSGGEAYNLYANANTNTPVIYVVRSAASGSPLDTSGPSALALNTWTHLAATFDNTTVRLYVSGVQVATRAVAGPLLTTTGVLRLGGNSVWGEFFAGRIDDVRLYNRALSATEIQADMNAPVQP